MIKKLLIYTALFSLISVSASAQSFYAELNYQSFRPFINFRIELGNSPYQYQRNNYQTAYLKGYMDGVNQTYYNAYRFYDLVYNINAYEAGYRDGLRDQALFYRLRGYNHLRTHYFTYDDYYSPYYSVQIWLNQLSFTFIQAPARYLPPRWEHHIHPRIKYYRKQFHNKRGFYKRFEAQFNNHKRRLKSQARYRQKRYRRTHPSYSQGPRRNVTLNPRQAQQRVRSRASNTNNNRPELRRRVQSQPNRGIQSRNRSTQRVGTRGSGSRQKVRGRSNGNANGGKVKRGRSRSRTGSVKSRGTVKRSRGQSNQKVGRKSSGQRKVKSRSRSRQSKVKTNRKGKNKSKNSKRHRGGNSRKRGGNN